MTIQTGPMRPATPATPWGNTPGPVPPPPPELDPETGLPAGAHHRNLAYHRLALSDPRHRRWSPLAEGGVLAAGIILVSIVFFIVFFIVAMIVGADSFMAEMNTADVESLDMTNPWIFFFMFGSIAIWLPVVFLTRWLFRPRPLGLIWSVTGRIRCKWLLLTMGLATAVFVAIYGGVTLVEVLFASPADAGQVNLAERHPWWWLTLAMMLVVVPLQCTAEELVFRGYMAQALGRWLKNPAWVILLPAPLFMLGHLYDVWGQLSVLWMAIVTGFLTWKTGGLEAAISLHVVNNLIVTITSLLWPVEVDEGVSSSVGLLGFGVIFVIELVYAVIVLLLVKRAGIAVSRRAVVWPKKDQDRWYDRVRASYGPAGYQQPARPAPPMRHPGAAPRREPVLVPVTIPASMAYVDASRVNDDGSLRLVPADGLIAYAAPEQQQIPGTDPPVYAHPVVWMAKEQHEHEGAHQ